MLTGLVGLALMAHELLKKLGLIVSDVSLETVYSNWLLGYSSLLGPIAGIMVVDYFLIKKQQLDLAGLYRDDVYPAWNWNGFLAFGVPVVLTLLSLGSDAFSWFYSYGWFTGSALGGLIYYGLCAMRPQPVSREIGGVRTGLIAGKPAPTGMRRRLWHTEPVAEPACMNTPTQIA